MITIWKFPIKIEDEQYIVMPKFNELLTVQLQDNIPTLWAIVDTDYPIVKKYFELFGTGHVIPTKPNRKYVGTFQLENGLVFHLFEKFDNA